MNTDQLFYNTLIMFDTQKSLKEGLEECERLVNEWDIETLAKNYALYYATYKSNLELKEKESWE